jgi:hypothetical protein
VGFVEHKVALGQVFSWYFGFPCQFSFHRLLRPHHHKPVSGFVNGIKTFSFKFNQTLLNFQHKKEDELKK